MEHKIELYTIQNNTYKLIPYFDRGIQAGFPSPAADYMESAIDLTPIAMPSAFASFDLATTQPSLLLSTTMGFPTNEGLNTLWQLA